MNECVDGWVEDVESDQMQSERKKESDQWPAAIENEDLTGTGQLAISEPERSFHPKIFHSASYLRFKQIAGPKNIQHNEIQGKMTLEMVELLLTKEIANMKMIWMNEARCGWGLWPDIFCGELIFNPQLTQEHTGVWSNIWTRVLLKYFLLSIDLLLKSNCPMSIFSVLEGHGLSFFSLGQYLHK